MEVKNIIKIIEEARKNSKERAFKQSFDCIVNLKNLDLRKPEHKVDLGVTINNPVRHKPFRIAAVIDHAITNADKVFDKVIYKEDLDNYKGDLKKIRALAKDIDKFVVQSTVMPAFAQVFGRYLGPLNKMPNPRLGMVVTEKTNLEGLKEKLQKTVHLQTKKSLVLQFSFGSETEENEKAASSLKHVLDTLEQNLPLHNNNLKDIYVKLTMGKLVRL